MGDERQLGGGGGRSLSAQEYRKRFAWLNSFSDEELMKISFCGEDEQLKEGERYFDLSHPERGVIVATTNQRSPSGSCYVASSQVSDGLWRKLTTSFGQSSSR